MKIAIFLDQYRPEDGGAFTMQQDLLRALCDDEAYKKDLVVVASSATNLPADMQLETLRYDGEKATDRFLALLVRLFPSLRRRLKVRTRFERFIRSRGVEMVWFLSPRPVDLDLPYVTTVWDLQHRKQPWFPEVSEFSEWETRERRLAPFLRRATFIFVGTEAGKKEVSDFYQIPHERIFALPHPTPSDVLNLNVDVPLPVGVTPGYLFYPAQFWAHKNHANLLYAIAGLRAEGKAVHLVLTGADFGNREFIEALVRKLDLSDQVSILGFVDRSTLFALYKNALALAYLSFFGPENLPPLEAFALNCPVIAAKVDGAEEQFEDAAVLVDPASVEEIQKAILRVMEDPAFRSDLIAKGKARASRWTAKHFVDRAFKIIKDFEAVRRTWAA